MEGIKKLSPMAMPGLFYVMSDQKVPYAQLFAPLIQAIEKYTGFKYEEFKLKTRKREIVEARQYFHSIMYSYSDASLQKIGDYFDQDHATVHYGIKTMDNLIETQPTKKLTHKKILAEIFSIRAVKAGRNIRIKDVKVQKTTTHLRYVTHLGIEVPELHTPYKRHAGFYDKGVKTS